MAQPNQKTSIPKVPIRADMWDGPGMKGLGNLTRTWIYFFEHLLKSTSSSAAAGAVYQRTLLLKDTTVGNDIADHVDIWVKGSAALVVGVLRKSITADLSVRINVVVGGVSTALGTFTIPHATAVSTPVQFGATLFSRAAALPVLAVLTWDVTASDGSKDNGGIASYTLTWQ